jgi:signal transduction histidine kinase
MRAIRIDFSIDDTPPSLGAMLKLIGLPDGFGSYPTSPPPDDDLTIDLSACGHLGSMAVTTLIALRRAFLYHERTLALIPPPPEDQALYGYCLYSGLLYEFGVGPAPTDHPKNVTVPGAIFTHIGAERAVLKFVHKFVGLSIDDEGLLSTSLQELMTNTRDHSQSGYGGVLSARVHLGKGELRAVVVDTGIGIRRSLEPRVPVQGDRDAVRRALDEGVSARSVRRNMGMGLPSIQLIVSGNGGELVLASGHGVVRAGATVQSYPLDARFPGTLAMIKFKIRPNEISDDV